MQELVIATKNVGKIEEFKVLMKDLAVELKSLEEWPELAEPEETGKTFAANARLKAIYYAKQTGKRCIADDSGLEVQT
ncbi:MAG: non-canonical purine NTP pyrophosphatase, partial [Acidaminococcaceae bacterium]